MVPIADAEVWGRRWVPAWCLGTAGTRTLSGWVGNNGGVNLIGMLSIPRAGESNKLGPEN